MDKRSFQKAFEANRERYLREWKELLGFPSISIVKAHDRDCLACANWLVKHLRDIGFNSRLLKTPSKPVVYAERKGLPGKPTVLFYGHYDVQPVDPIEEWLSPPFEPSLRRGRVYARGAHDDKGQLLYGLKAMETLIKQGALNVTTKIVIEGEEEGGSEGISAAVKRWKDIIKADVLMVTDTSTVRTGAPTIVMGLRGIIRLMPVLSGPCHDLHSGVHGGVAPNPATAMAHLVATLHNPDGSIAVKGFYDGVKEPSKMERSLANGTSFNAKLYKQETGILPMAGEKRFTPAERAGFRPTIEINGIHSGYGGDGSKTIIPAKAMAKITARLVAGQDPGKCLKLIIRHLRKHCPAGLRLDILEKGTSGPAVKLDPRSPLVARARRVLAALSCGETAFMWDGASIPIVAALSEVSGAEPLLIGFGRERDNIHAPNESFSLEQFRLGYLYAAMMLSELGA
jgi:acetylornithine deacetylase/succinyl-diaminopimelate desuccinylase-like protein